MEVRPIDGNKLVDKLKQIVSDYKSYGMHPSEFPIEYAIEIVEKMPTLTPQNEPLTLEQLREMDGKAAYVPETNCWVLVTKNPFVPLFTWPDGEQCSAYDWYEQVGPVYRHPPEGEKED